MEKMFEATTATSEVVYATVFPTVAKPTFINWNFKEIECFLNEVVEIARNLYNYNYKYCKHRMNFRLKRAYAQCYYATGLIEISRFLLNDYEDSFIKSTLIHEVCHALSYQFDGEKSKVVHNHDKIFKSMCKTICFKMGVPDGSSAFECGKTKSEVIKEYQESRIKIEVIDKIIVITENDKPTLIFKYDFIRIVDTVFIKNHAITVPILDSS